MVDYVKIKIKAGNGGNGAVSFFRTKVNPVGRPDGGDGGKGGDVYLVGSEDSNTLLEYNFNKHFDAPSGAPGGTNQKMGKSGEDLVMKVPVGTLVRLVRKLGEKKLVEITPADSLIADITQPGQQVLLAKGGHGGRGNMHLKGYHPGKEYEGRWERTHSSEPGEAGEEFEITLELKLLADAGLIGFPNAGKSTLLSELTKATPKIANYPFTTLEPVLGVLEHQGKHAVLADIPGLIEGASAGKGLGTQFLKHIQRTKVLVHVISAETEDLKKAYETINQEMATYSKELVAKPQIVFISKTDLADPEELGERMKALPKGLTVIKGSSFTKEGLEDLQKTILKHF